MKAAIPWALALALLAGGYFLYTDDQGKDAELTRLRQEHDEFVQSQAENEELKKSAADPNELARLRKDNEELLRLRNEARYWREQASLMTNEVLSAERGLAEAQSRMNAAAQNQSAQLDDADLQAAIQSQLCMKNLRLIEAAKEKWAQENSQPPGAVPSDAELMAYLPQNVMPVCPGGGQYSPNAIGVLPTCSIPSHNLPVGQH